MAQTAARRGLITTSITTLINFPSTGARVESWGRATLILDKPDVYFSKCEVHAVPGRTRGTRASDRHGHSVVGVRASSCPPLWSRGHHKNARTKNKNKKSSHSR